MIDKDFTVFKDRFVLCEGLTMKPGEWNYQLNFVQLIDTIRYLTRIFRLDSVSFYRLILGCVIPILEMNKYPSISSYHY